MIQSSKFLMLRESDLFEALNDLQVEQLANQSTFKKLSKNAYLFRAGDKRTSVYFVTNGSFKTGRRTSNDKTLIKEIIYKGELIGANFMSIEENSKDFSQALEDSEVFEIPAVYFKSLLEKNPVFCQRITQLLLHKMSNLETRMNNFVFKKAQSRIVDFLRELAQTQGIKIGLDEVLINHGLSHKEIAYITDTSRQTVARVLGDLKRQNIIHFSARKPNKILIRSALNLS